jgi:hypothetical protein
MGTISFRDADPILLHGRTETKGIWKIEGGDGKLRHPSFKGIREDLP